MSTSRALYSRREPKRYAMFSYTARSAFYFETPPDAHARRRHGDVGRRPVRAGPGRRRGRGPRRGIRGSVDRGAKVRQSIARQQGARDEDSSPPEGLRRHTRDLKGNLVVEGNSKITLLFYVGTCSCQ